VRARHDDVVAGVAGDQFGLKDLVGVVVVVVDLDAGLFLEVLDRVVGDVVGPVVDVEHLRVGSVRQAGSAEQGEARPRSEAAQAGRKAMRHGVGSWAREAIRIVTSGPVPRVETWYGAQFEIRPAMLDGPSL